MNYKLIFLTFLFPLSILFSQINGLIKDSHSGKPIGGVNIISGAQGTSSNLDGEFIINITTGSEISFSHVGYKSLIIKAEQSMNIQMDIIIIQQKEIIIRSGLSDESLDRLHSSISVIGSDDIRKISVEHFQNLTDQIPNLNWAGGTSRPRYFQIRGLGENSHYFGEGPPNFSVGFVYDNIDLSGLGMVGFTHDINQIEVFKGAQSTIFGANSIGGLISINSNNPTEKFEAKINSSFGNDGYYNVGGILNLSLSRKLGIRLSSSKNYSNGFRENLFLNSKKTNKRSEMINRIKFHFAPSKNLTFLGALIYLDQDNGYDAWAPDNNKNFITYSDTLGMDSQLTKGLSLKADYQILDNLKITSISSFSNVELNHSYDGDWANDEYWLEKHGFDPQLEYYEYKFFDKNNRQRETFTQELRTSFASLVLGTYVKYLSEKDKANGYLYGGLATEAESKYDFNSKAAYIQYELSFVKKFKLKTNFRYENNDISYSSQSADTYYYTPIPSIETKIKSPMIGYSTVLSYNTNYINYYASVSRGYKAGGINQEPNLSELNRSYEPEYIINGELGLKSYRNNIGNQLNLFLGQRTDQQVSISSQQNYNDPNSFLFYTSNATKGMISGLEFESKYYGEKIQIGANLGYLKTRVEKFKYNISSVSSEEAGNRESAMSPNLNGSISFLGYIRKDMYLNVISTYKSKYYFSDSHDYTSSSYSLTNISIGYSFRNIEFKYWVRNLFNEVYETRGFYFGLIPPDFNDQLFKSYGDPRHMGISLDYNF